LCHSGRRYSSDRYSLFGKRPLVIASMNAELPPFKNGGLNSESASTIDRDITPLIFKHCWGYSTFVSNLCSMLSKVHGFKLGLHGFVSVRYLVSRVWGTRFRRYRVWGTEFLTTLISEQGIYFWRYLGIRNCVSGALGYWGMGNWYRILHYPIDNLLFFVDSLEAALPRSLSS